MAVVGIYKGFAYSKQRHCGVFPWSTWRRRLWFGWVDARRSDLVVCGVPTKRELIELLDQEDDRLRRDPRSDDPRRRNPERRTA